MHIVVGRRTTEVGAAGILALARAHRRTVVDLGTGDGRAALILAAADPETFVLGIDADARAMAEASRRAAAAPAKGGRPNVAFVASGVELLPVELDGIADRVTLRFPWGSLLRGAIGVDPSAARAIARLIRPGGTLEIALSIVEHDRLGARDEGDEADVPAAGREGRDALTSLGRPFEASDVERIRATFGELGLELTSVEPMTREQVRAYGSRWARRLRVGVDRPAWRLSLRRREQGQDPG